jgi:hypothetical protein
MCDTGNLGPQEVAFLTWELRVGVDSCVKVSGEDVLDLACSLYMGWGCIWQLDPVLKKAIINPVNELVKTLTSAFM